MIYIKATVNPNSCHVCISAKFGLIFNYRPFFFASLSVQLTPSLVW